MDLFLLELDNKWNRALTNNKVKSFHFDLILLVICFTNCTTWCPMKCSMILNYIFNTGTGHILGHPVQIIFSGVPSANRTKLVISHLTNVTQSQVGNYTCLVNNQSGENGSKTIQLEVKGSLNVKISNLNVWQCNCCISDECNCKIRNIQTSNTSKYDGFVPLFSDVSQVDSVRFTMLVKNFDPHQFHW